MNSLDYFKNRLVNLKKELTKQIKAIDKDIKHEGMSADWGEQATERENDEVLESLGLAAQEELANIDKALGRIRTEEYFYCAECGNDIPPSRLELLPFVTSCVTCAEKLEN